MICPAVVLMENYNPDSSAIQEYAIKINKKFILAPSLNP